MSYTGSALLLLWMVLLGVWIVRLPSEKLYAPRPWVYLWIAARVLLRGGIGLFAVLAWESYRTPSPTPAYALVVDAACPEAWTAATQIARGLFAERQRVGLIAVTSKSAFWAIPPSHDSTLFSALLTHLKESAPTSTDTVAYHSALRQLRPYLRANYFTAAVWIGRFTDTLSEGIRLPLCPGELTNLQSLRLPSPPLSEGKWYGLGALLCVGLLLIGEGYFYLLRKHLPLRLQP